MDFLQKSLQEHVSEFPACVFSFSTWPYSVVQVLLLFIPHASFYYEQIAAITSASLSFAALIATSVLNLWWNIDLKKLRRIGLDYEMLQVAVDKSEEKSADVPDGLPGSPPSRVYGSRRGEHQLDLFFPNPPHLRAGGGFDDSPSSSPILVEREPLLFDYDQN